MSSPLYLQALVRTFEFTRRSDSIASTSKEIIVLVLSHDFLTPFHLHDHTQRCTPDVDGEMEIWRRKLEEVLIEKKLSSEKGRFQLLKGRTAIGI